MKKLLTQKNLSNLLIFTLGVLILTVVLIFFLDYRHKIIGVSAFSISAFTTVVFLIDALVQKIRDKVMWVFLILSFPFFSIPVYLNKRQELLREEVDGYETKGMILVRKTLILIFAVSICVNIISGVLKMFHLPYASTLFIYNLILQAISLIGIFFVLPRIKKHRKTKSINGNGVDNYMKTRNILKNVMGFAFVLLPLGAVFKIQHWPYASFFLNTGIILIGLSLIGLFVVLPLRKGKDKIDQE